MTTKSQRTARWWIFLFILYLALLAAIAVLDAVGAERSWLGALNLYLPQAMWLLPGLALFFLALRFAGRLAWLPALCLLWVLGPVMGLSFPLHTPRPLPGDVPLRVMTCNAKYGRYDPAGLFLDITHYRPDLILLQDAEGARRGALVTLLKGWTVRSYGQYIIASRLPLSAAEPLAFSYFSDKHSCLRARLKVGAREVTVYNVHLQTPRAGLNAFRRVKSVPWYLPHAVERFEDNVEARLAQAEVVREMVRQEKNPVILAGDLNSPDGSRTCIMLREAGLHDAFAESGRGYGYTYGHKLLQHRIPWFRVSWMRIDHVMMSGDFHAVKSWTGNATSSEHRPVIADLVLRGR